MPDRGTRIEQAETRTDEANARTTQAETLTDEANARTEQAETRTGEANLRTKRAEDSERGMRASEISYRRLFETAQDGILILDAENGRVMDANPFLVKLLGFPHGEMVGKTVGELSPFEDLVTNQAMLERLQRDGYVRYEDLPMEARDGRHVDVEFVSNVYQAGDSKVIQCNIRDITVRKQAEIAFNRMAAIVESSEDAIYGADLDRNITSWNNGAEKIFGYSAAEMVGASSMRLIPADRQDEENEIHGRIVSGKIATHWETVRQTKDGRLLDVSMTASAIKDRAGKVVGVSKVARDITEQRRKKEELSRSEARFRSLVTATSQIVWNASAEGEVSGSLPIWQEYTGQTVDEVQASGWTRALHPDDVPHTMAVWMKAVETRSLYEVDYRLRRRDGVYRIFTVRGVPVLNDDGTVREWVGTCADITDRKRAEAEIRELNTSLEQRVVKRTAELEAANKELEAFSYSVSHDLRAPLRGIDSFSRMVIEDYGPSLDAEGQRQLNVIGSEALRMGQLIDELLRFSRLGRQEIKVATFDMTALAQSVFDDLPAAARLHVKEFRLHPLPPAHGDRAMIRQVLVNLIGNAVKYSAPAEAPVIEVSGETVDGISTYRVKDNGVGFDPRYTHKLFGVFQRLHAEHEFEGTGVGLAIVQRIVHRHGGKVAAEGLLNHGATFSFSLPIKNQTNLQTENGNHD